jgi:hypothetical protein
LHPNLSKPVIALPLVALALVAISVLTFFLAGFEKSYSGFSSQYVVDQARQAYKDNHFDEAATFLERLALTHKLDEDSKTLLNDVYLARSSQRVQRLDYVGAMADLDKIPPQYSKFVLVTGRKNELTELIKVRRQQQQAQSFPLPKNRSRSDRSKSHLASKESTQSSPGEQSMLAPPVMPAANSTESNWEHSPSGFRPQSLASRFDSQATRGDSQSLVAHGDSHSLAARGNSQSPVARGDSQSPVARGDARAAIAGGDSALANDSATPPQPDASRSDSAAKKVSAGKPRAVKITENDQVRYNELLAGYFSQEHKQLSAAAEPPSLKEWIDSGRPKF